jgi:molecular chaperone HtpG
VPPYLRFLRGVIDSQDLPLNISRETLQKNAVIDKIQSGVTSRVLGDLKKRAESDSADYASFWQHFGAVLKEGLCEGNAPREKIFEACRFYSTHSPDALTSLDDYIARMKEGQEAIYFITGETLAALESSPQIEGFKARGIEVLLLTDHVDDFWVNVSREYKGKPIKSVIKSGEDLKKFEGSDAADASSKNEEKAADQSQAMDALVTRMKRHYGEAVKDVRVTYKLKESPVCLAVAEGDMDMRMERFLLEHKQLPTRQAKILEINPTHPIISALAERIAASAGGEGAFDDTLWLLLDQANIAEGEPVSDMAAYMRRVNALLSKAV